MNYCSNCGSSQLVWKKPRGEHLLRQVCEQCQTIHYQNPKIIAGCLPVWENKILLCKRAIEPRYGLWTVPAGFMENGESIEEAAIRETWEEANAKVDLKNLYMMYSIMRVDQLYVLFLAQLKNLNFHAGEESLEVRLFSEEEIPWKELAFQIVEKTVTYYFNDFKQNSFPTHIGKL
jgi:ADP-ribose pyrophosphatase YjhB (NUDIX family)